MVKVDVATAIDNSVIAGVVESLDVQLHTMAGLIFMYMSSLQYVDRQVPW